MPIETLFDVALIAKMARREKQIQQHYRPIIAVHKWFARRPGTLFRGLTLAEFGDRPLSESFFAANDFPGRTVADPFMGGGTPLLEANRVGCDVLGYDINPMAAWVVREEIEHLDHVAYRREADALVEELTVEVGAAYVTDCPIYGDPDVPVKYFLWVKTVDCEECGADIDLFPGYLVAANARHPKHVVLCGDCGEFAEVADRDHLGSCRRCARPLAIPGPARRQRCPCRQCGHPARYPRAEAGPPRHRLFAIEYYNPTRKAEHRGRFFKKPDARDLARYASIEDRWAGTTPEYVPEQPIPPGDETDRLHRWGYRRYRELFNARQLLGLELSARRIAAVSDERIRRALATNLSDLLRYQNMLCRYDTTALKSLDVFSVHGFPAGLVQCESNILGITTGDGAGVGSGGWTNIITKYAKAKRFCDAPFEVDYSRGRKTVVPIPGDWIGERHDGRRPRRASIRCVSSTALDLAPNTLDAVFTDPPYFGNVQYGELMDFCYVWLRRLIGSDAEGFDRESTRSPDELTGNRTLARDLKHFTDGISAVYRAMAEALKPGAPLAFTFHHNSIEPYHAICVATLDAGLVCSASIPCPAEMGGSIHIHGTGSSIVDTIFVCRKRGQARSDILFEDLDGLSAVVRTDLAQLRAGGVTPSAGDIRCVVFGHLTRMAIWRLRHDWDSTRPTAERLNRVAATVAALGDPTPLVGRLAASPVSPAATAQGMPLFPDDHSPSFDAVPF